MRIASVCRVLPSPADSAAGAFVARRIGAMARQTEVRAIQPVPYFPGLRPLPAWARTPQHEVDGLGIEHAPMFYVPGVLKSFDGYWLARSVSPAFRRLLRSRSVDLIDAHFGYPDGVGCFSAARKLGLPVFITVRGMEVDALRNPALASQLLPALQQAAGCICVSHSLRDVLATHGVDPGAMAVIPNAVDRTKFRPGNQSAAREVLGLARDRRYVVSIGHLVAGKKHDVLIRALAQIRRQSRDVELIIIGGAAYDPDCPRNLKRLADELGVGGAVRFAGRIPPADIATWLQAADLFALGTEREGCCNAVLEALACGLPVVTTPAGDNPYFVKNGSNGWIVPIGDDAAMAQAIVRTLDSRWDAPVISAALQVEDWDSVARQVLAYFAARLSSSARSMH
jgi:teichuronic acid biosynthesis glycosyltransferase TuaC